MPRRKHPAIDVGSGRRWDGPTGRMVAPRLQIPPAPDGWRVRRRRDGGSTGLPAWWDKREAKR